ncbi:unnamed protein product [Ilex paraguariensis]|uniref:Uncharacterized protein n=1 Tax=Ilex paraguariensis TaxID=185542 RepID=A0ABC8T2K1_9AQUA
MEKYSSARDNAKEDDDDKEEEEEEEGGGGGLFSCWGRLKLMLPWKRRKRSQTRQRNVRVSYRNVTRKSKGTRQVGGFRYDALSYAQNFDESCWDDGNEDSSYRGFSSRYAAPSSKSMQGSNEL